MPKITHNHLFLFGFVYYLMLPLAVGHWELLAEMPGMPVWHGHFQNLSATALAFYSATIAGMFVAFYAGSFSTLAVPKLRFHSQPPFRHLRRNGLLLAGIAIVLLALISFFLARNIDLVLTGYRRGYDQRLLGMLATLLMFSVFMAIYLTQLRRRPFVARAFTGISIGCALLMLSMGARMYALVALIAFLIYKTGANRRTGGRFFRLALLGSTAALLALVIGLWRVGLAIEPDLAIYVLIAEPAFTWFSASTFMANNLQSLEALHVPTNFAVSFVNFVPSIVLENKSQLIVQVADYFPYESPFGADSIFVSAVGNFGWLGAQLYMFVVGFSYSAVRLLGKDLPFFRTYYILIAALLPFQFFRDNFSILNKQIFWNLLLLPGLVVVLSRLVAHARPVSTNQLEPEVTNAVRLPSPSSRHEFDLGS
jgi:hypothetical protein